MHKHAAIKRRIDNLTLVLPFTLLLSALLFSSAEAQQNMQGKAIFEKNCAVCHKISADKLVGPGLKDVTKRRDKAWMAKFIRGSQEIGRAHV